MLVRCCKAERYPIWGYGNIFNADLIASVHLTVSLPQPLRVRQALPCSTAMPSPSAHPNVLLIVGDDHQADAIAALGHPVVRTPVLDGLVRDGTAFTQVRIMGSLMAAVCAPSRACLLTGRNVFRADASPVLSRGPKYQVRLPADACTLPECFRAAGYQTHVTGKWHNCRSSLTRSFSSGSRIFLGGMSNHTGVPVFDYDPSGAYRSENTRVAEGFSSEIFADAAIDFIGGWNRRQPFLLYLAFTSPHDPRTPPKPFRQNYIDSRIPLPPNFLPEHPFDNGELHIRDEELASFPRQPEEIRRHLADYYGMISHQDAQIGRVVEALRLAGVLDSTIIVYLSDHGLALGQHGLMGKQNLYEHSVRVPLVLRGPGVPRGERRSSLAYSFDVYATLCSLAGIAPPPGIDSRSLVPAFAHPSLAVRDELCSLYMDCQRMVTNGRWKLIRYHVNGLDRVQLFDLDCDPYELHDVAAMPSHAAIIAEMAARLSEWQEDVGDCWMRGESSAVARK